MSQQALNLSSRQIRIYGDTPIPVKLEIAKKRGVYFYLRTRNIKKQIWLNECENNTLKENSKRAGLSEAGYVRKLILGYKLKEQPTEVILEMMNQIRGIGTNLNQIAKKANTLNMIDAPYYRNVYEKFCKLEQKLNEKLFESRK